MDLGEIITEKSGDAVKRGLKELFGKAKACKNFKEAYEKKEIYYNNRRKKYIVQTEFLNKKFGEPYYLMPKWLSCHLFALGGKRTTRQIYDGTKRIVVVSVWVFEDAE